MRRSSDLPFTDLSSQVHRTGSASPIVHIPYDEAYEEGFEDMMRRVPDIRKVGALIGYRPTLGIDEILERVIADQKVRQAAGTV